MRRIVTLVLLLLAVVPAASAHADAPRSCSDLLLPMSDGVRLHGWVNHETPVARRPVLLTISSYQNSTCPGPSSYFLSPAVANGFSMVFVSMRGSGASEGEFDLFGSKTQGDIHAVISWIAKQPWSNGRIVVAGSSGNGIFIMDALKEPAVKAALAMTACPDLYRCFHHGGAEGDQIGAVYMANNLQGYEAGLQGRQAKGTGTNPTPPQQLAAFGAQTAATKLHPTYDDFWAQRSMLSQLKALDKPIMWTTSDFDLLEILDGLPLARNAYLNMGVSHSVWWDLTSLGSTPPAYQRVILGQMNQFVAHYGLGQGAAPPRVALMTADGGFPAWLKQDAYVRTESAWPLKGTRWTDLWLDAAGGLASAPGSGSETSPLVSSPGVGQDLRTAMLAPVLARGSGGVDVSDAAAPLFDLRHEEAAGLTYTTPALKQSLEVTGPLVLRLWATSYATDFTWAVRVTDVAPDGRSEWITDGYLRAGMRAYDPARSQKAGGRIVRIWRDYDKTEPVPLGAPAEYLVDVADMSNVFRAGHRIRLDVLPLAGAGYDTGSTPGAGAVTILHDKAHPSRLQVPVIPSRCQASEPLTAAAAPPPACAASYADAIAG